MLGPGSATGLTLGAYLRLVGARSLTQLKGHAAVAALSARKTGLTAGDVSELAQALPRCRIEHDGGAIEPTKK